MADQHNENIPAMANEISSDIPDIKENLEFHWDIFEQIMLTTSKTSAIGNLLKQQFVRSKFTYNGGTTAYTIKCEPAIYHCKDKYCYWDEELTTTAIGSPAADTRYYLYIDYSAVTSYTAITDPPTTELIWSDTAPTWNDTYKQWMNEDDRCIFGVLANDTPNNIYEFFHDGGDLVLWADALVGGTTAITDFDYSAVNLNTIDDSVFLPAPAFCTKVLATFQLYLNNEGADNYLSWKTKDQTGTTGHRVAFVESYDASTDAYDFDVNTATVITDSSQTIEVFNSVTDNSTVNVWCDGWYFPTGM